ncbi:MULTISPECIES: NUDIX domain-containing protein [unclassified Crossiella]|uniref:NUDIX domain-containing protein n=1 Tax=unclassified Crossiella TaxID=2620835 RepID=UPI001FFEA1F4|nr:MULTISPECIES: NUDIX domain-containing protein [unclassified Crossiella]MCK2244285.1 NUDIX domain-containing protein [Crossiella sp. S99.2]MCK2257887.1 NUDIX domain-containing protein [Crossiella sp. S99.1]
MARRSAGILVHRNGDNGPEVLLGHLGGPFWANKDEAAWSIPKGEHTGDEPPEDAARREFLEELGLPVPEGELVPLGEARQSAKVVAVWALAGSVDLDRVVLGTFEMEWPPRSGKFAEFPELDRVAWFDLETAAVKLVKGQRVFLERLAARL